MLGPLTLFDHVICAVCVHSSLLKFGCKNPRRDESRLIAQLNSSFRLPAETLSQPVQINFDQQVGCVSPLNPAMQVEAAAFIC
ncbi:hypothetical protein HMPREF0484_1186 [Klebsiella pneumoniae subsp. rhinoscleromatis ATCC 13884]|nr:hypothetical protein HMPREF0484_1186 [Klebsiella pneumoniae subsp. rhinoscleromatis ATCC 13884]